MHDKQEAAAAGVEGVSRSSAAVERAMNKKVVEGLQGTVRLAANAEFEIKPQRAKNAHNFITRASDALAQLVVDYPSATAAKSALMLMEKLINNMLVIKQEVGEDQARLFAQGCEEAERTLKKADIQIPMELGAARGYFEFLTTELAAQRKAAEPSLQKEAEAIRKAEREKDEAILAERRRNGRTQQD